MLVQLVATTKLHFKHMKTQYYLTPKSEEVTCHYLIFFHLRRFVFNQSSPVHHVSESRGGCSERDGGRTED